MGTKVKIGDRTQNLTGIYFTVTVADASISMKDKKIDILLKKMCFKGRRRRMGPNN